MLYRHLFSLISSVRNNYRLILFIKMQTKHNLPGIHSGINGFREYKAPKSNANLSLSPPTPLLFNLLLLITIAINNHFPLIKSLLLEIGQENETQPPNRICHALFSLVASEQNGKQMSNGQLEKEKKRKRTNWLAHSLFTHIILLLAND